MTLDSRLYELENVSFHYRRGRPVLQNLDFTVSPGDFIGLVGPNGAGKSTLLQLLTGWLKPTAGTISFRGKHLTAWTRPALAREVALVPQKEEGVFAFTVAELVMMGRFPYHSGIFGLDDENDRAIAESVIRDVCLEGFEQRTLQELSGGEQQRVLVARALAQRTPVLLLDEPTASLDLAHQRMLFALLERLNRETGLTIITVSHDINLAALYCREIVIVHQGSIAHRGTPAMVVTEEILSDVYKLPVSVTTSEAGTPAVLLRR